MRQGAVCCHNARELRKVEESGQDHTYLPTSPNSHSHILWPLEDWKVKEPGKRALWYYSSMTAEYLESAVFDPREDFS